MSQSAISMATERGGEDIAALEIRRAVAGLPEVLDAAGVFADQPAGEMLDHAGHAELAAGHAALTDAGDPFVGIDLDDELVAKPNLDRIRRDRRDLHRAPMASELSAFERPDRPVAVGRFHAFLRIFREGATCQPEVTRIRF